MSSMEAKAREKTFWKCEACGCLGDIEYESGLDVYSVLYLIEDSHAMAPTFEGENLCKFDVAQVKVSKTPFGEEGSAV